MNLRELTLADAPWCAELEQLLFPGDSPWSVEEFQSEIAHVLNKIFWRRNFWAACGIRRYGGVGAS